MKQNRLYAVWMDRNKEYGIETSLLGVFVDREQAIKAAAASSKTLPNHKIRIVSGPIPR